MTLTETTSDRQCVPLAYKENEMMRAIAIAVNRHNVWLEGVQKGQGTYLEEGLGSVISLHVHVIFAWIACR